MTTQELYQLIATVNEKYNQILTNAKTIDELTEQLELVDTSFIHVSNNGVSEKLQISKIIDAIVTNSLNQLLFVGEITIDGNEITIPAGVQWKILNINYFTSIDYVFDIIFCEEGKIRKAIVVANTLNQLILINGPEGEGVAVRPNIPINTVLVTELNVTDSGFDYVVVPVDNISKVIDCSLSNTGILINDTDEVKIEKLELYINSLAINKQSNEDYIFRLIDDGTVPEQDLPLYFTEQFNELFL